ncbi:hypothetical protein BpHYR1_032866, partial [Brachionus plicatilis]
KNAEIDSELNRNNDIAFVKSLHELLVEMSKMEQSDRRPIYTPRKFVNTVWTLLSFWSDGSQQDAHEFLQYTIHFINECDLSLRKLQQQYHSDQAADEAKPKRAGRKTPRQADITTLATSNPLLLVTDESSSSSVSSTCSSSASSTSAVSAPIFRLKTAPNTASTIHTEANLLRTPTKGGASSFNISLLDSSLNSKKESQEELIFRPLIKSDTLANKSATKKSSPILTDSDLVSKRLKETLNSPPFKMAQQCSSNGLANDSDSIIIMDSDDEVYFMDDNEPMPPLATSAQLCESFALKKCYVLLEKIKLEKMEEPIVQRTSPAKPEVKLGKKFKRTRPVENSVILMDLDAISCVSAARSSSSANCE